MEWEVVIPEVAAQRWDKDVLSLPDCTLFQTFLWGEYKKSLGWSPLRLCVRDVHGLVRAAAQFLVRPLPFGLSVVWGAGAPLGLPACWGPALREAVSNSVGAQFRYVKIKPHRRFCPEDARNLHSQGWTPSTSPLGSGLSIWVDLTKDPLRGLSSNWRHNLKRAGKYGLQVYRWLSPDVHEIFAVYSSMQEYKGLPDQYSPHDLDVLLRTFGSSVKIFRCDDNTGRIVALRGCIQLGNRAWDQFAATTPEGRKLYASYLLLFTLFEECRKTGVEHYDLMSVDPVRNPGVYNFKRGTGGEEVRYTGEWDWGSVPLLRRAANLVIRRRGGRL